MYVYYVHDGVAGVGERRLGGRDGGGGDGEERPESKEELGEEGAELGLQVDGNQAAEEAVVSTTLDHHLQQVGKNKI
jgi:hypothetical protein